MVYLKGYYAFFWNNCILFISDSGRRAVEFPVEFSWKLMIILPTLIKSHVCFVSKTPSSTQLSSALQTLIDIWFELSWHRNCKEKERSIQFQVAGQKGKMATEATTQLWGDASHVAKRWIQEAAIVWELQGRRSIYSKQCRLRVTVQTNSRRPTVSLSHAAERVLAYPVRLHLR